MEWNKEGYYYSRVKEGLKGQFVRERRRQHGSASF